MNKFLLVGLMVAGFGFTSAQAAITASSVATWKASATKDTTSELVITPVGTLDFIYSEQIAGFYPITGKFDVAIKGDSVTPATSFTLKAKKLAGTLGKVGGGSTVDVDVMWQGVKVANTDVTLIDTGANINGGLLSPIASGFNKAGRTTAQANFSFSVANPKVDGVANPTMADLPDGEWFGDVTVEFIANWV